jgi:hypothetical protein
MNMQPATSNNTTTVTPTEIPAIVPVDSLAPAAPPAGNAVAVALIMPPGVVVLLAVGVSVLDVFGGAVGLEEADVTKISLIFGSELSFAGTRSLVGQDDDAQGLLAQQPINGGLLNLQVYHSPVSPAHASGLSPS